MPAESEAIVVVDDDDGLRLALERVLSAAGFRAEAAPCLREARRR